MMVMAARRKDSGQRNDLYREVPVLLIGEGTAEIHKMIVGRRLLEEYRITG